MQFNICVLRLLGATLEKIDLNIKASVNTEITYLR